MSDTGTAPTTKVTTTYPTLWNVIVYNDDFTPYEFVIEIMRQIFGKTEEEAIRVTELIHQSGKGGKLVVGTYTREMAVSKASLAIIAARQHGHPFLAEAKAA
jgi:ATP-dependent Clp protease adaptor protein ClpS